jgi:hypothetical protein
MSLENDGLDLADNLIDRYGLERAKQVLNIALKEIEKKLSEKPTSIPT